MLTKLTLRNFKRFSEAEVELGQTVVFVGPNNSGKTSALQSLALWDLGIRRLAERYGEKDPPEKRPGVTLNRKDLVALPVPNATMLWNGAHAFFKSDRIRIEIVVEGVTQGTAWECGLEFDYDNEESFSVRPLRLSEGKLPQRMKVPSAAKAVKLAFLPPMSGLVAHETKLEAGAVAVRIGEGRTAEVLRNLCLRVHSERPAAWEQLVARMQELFGSTLQAPEHLIERGEIEMSYVERGITLDLSSAGRGLQQTLLLLAYMYANPGAVLLLDEPDAHLEVLRQQQIYEVLTQVAAEQGSQIIAASHSEVLLNEAADRDMVVAFVGKPHRIDDRGSQVVKALKQLGFDQYYLAERKGWVLYLEGSTDLAILRAFASTIAHPAAALLERPFTHYVGNQASRAREHFYGLREAKPDLAGVMILDGNLPGPQSGPLLELNWKRREIENYLCFPEVLAAYATEAGATAGSGEAGPLFGHAEAINRKAVMEELVLENTPPAAMRDRSHSFWSNVKASDEFLDVIFKQYFERLRLPNLMRKTDYHVLAQMVPSELIDPEVSEKLDRIVEIAAQAQPYEKASES